MTVPENEKDDPIWSLLAQTKRLVVNPFFSRNVLRTVRLQEAAERERWGWWTMLWGIRSQAMMGVAGACAVTCLTASFFPLRWPKVHLPEVSSQMVVAPQVQTAKLQVMQAGSRAVSVEKEEFIDLIRAELEWLEAQPTSSDAVEPADMPVSMPMPMDMGMGMPGSDMAVQ
jgi:hypothetical protein